MKSNFEIKTFSTTFWNNVIQMMEHINKIYNQINPINETKYEKNVNAINLFEEIQLN